MFVGFYVAMSNHISIFFCLSKEVIDIRVIFAIFCVLSMDGDPDPLPDPRLCCLFIPHPPAEGENMLTIKS